MMPAMDEENFLSKLERYGTARWQPVTFLERGVSMAFTTPMLLGARVRPVEKPTNNGVLELVVPNPSGGEGVYVLPWAALPDLCSPSLHDRHFWARVAELRSPSPRRIRDVARAVAAEGYAGRDAARAAATALAAERNSRLATHYFLLLRLIKQAEKPIPGSAPPEAEQPERLARRARAVLIQEMSDTAGGAEAAYRALEDIAEMLDSVGLPGNPTKASLPQLLSELEALEQTFDGTWGSPDESDRNCAKLVAASIKPTLALARLALAEAQNLADDVPGLLRRWLIDPQELRRLTARPDWLLDGWDLILGLWRAAGGEALRDMVVLLPVVPLEVQGWAGFEMELQNGALNVHRRTVRANQDWRTGRMLDIQRRNERVKAAAA